MTEVFHVPGGSGRVEPSVTAARSAGIPVHPVSDEVMAALTSTVTPQGVVAVAAFLDRSLEDAIAPGARCVPVLIHVRDPGNAGTILRTTDAGSYVDHAAQRHFRPYLRRHFH